MSSKLEKIKAKRDAMLDEKRWKNRQERLRFLVDTHGYDAVTLASGWKSSTIAQYLRNKQPMISEEKLATAERILAEI
jgi:hypothetical protein